MYSKIALVACLVSLAQAGGLLNSALNNAYEYTSSGWNNANGDYAKNGWNNAYGGNANNGWNTENNEAGYEGHGNLGSAVSHVSIIKEVSGSVPYNAGGYGGHGYGGAQEHGYGASLGYRGALGHGYSGAPATSYVSQYRASAQHGSSYAGALSHVSGPGYGGYEAGTGYGASYGHGYAGVLATSYVNQSPASHYSTGAYAQGADSAVWNKSW